MKKCSTCIKANIKKNSASTKDLMESMIHPYQGLFIDLGFSGQIFYDKNDKD